MPTPLLNVGEEGKGIVSSMGSRVPSVECSSHDLSSLKEQNYLGFSDCSSVDSSSSMDLVEGKNNLNLKATELRLGLPGSLSPGRELELSSCDEKVDEKLLFPLIPSENGIRSSTQKNAASGNKRGFADTVDRFPEKNWMSCKDGAESECQQAMRQGIVVKNSGLNATASPRPSEAQSATMKLSPQKALQQRPHAVNGTNSNQTGASNNSSTAPVSNRSRVVGWPPVRSFRKNTLATTLKNNDIVDGKPGPGTLFVKVSMDGAPYLRKVDLRSYSTYSQLTSALEKMFSCFIIGQCGPHGAPAMERLSKCKLTDPLHRTEYVLTYEDKDGDWMLVGDVPWEMFIDTCKRLKIMKGSDAIGLAPRDMEKSKMGT